MLLEGRRLQVGVDEERCVDDTEHRRTGDCFGHDWHGKERHRRERSRQRGNETKRGAISGRGSASERESHGVVQSSSVGDEVTDTGVRDRVTRRARERERERE